VTWTETIYDDGKGATRYVGCDALLHGDYCGSSCIGEANIASLIELCDEYGIEYDHIPARDASADTVRFGFRDAPQLPVLIVGGGWSSRWALIRDDDPSPEGSYTMPKVLRDVVAALADYPILDEDKHSETEMEAQAEAWESWVRDDLRRGLDEDVEDALDAHTPQPPHEDDDIEYTAFRTAAEECNEYWIDETGGMYFPVDRIKDAYAAALRELLGMLPEED